MREKRCQRPHCQDARRVLASPVMDVRVGDPHHLLHRTRFPAPGHVHSDANNVLGDVLLCFCKETLARHQRLQESFVHEAGPSHGEVMSKSSQSWLFNICMQ